MMVKYLSLILKNDVPEEAWIVKIHYLFEGVYWGDAT